MIWSILLSVLLFYGILIVVNIPAPLLGLEFESGSQPSAVWFAPPGYVIPLVWFVLFTLLGISRYFLLQSAQPYMQWWLLVLAILCASYAYYTLGLAQITQISALWFGLIGNFAVILFAALTVYKLLPVNQLAAWLVIPTIIWTAFASCIVWAELKLLPG